MMAIVTAVDGKHHHKGPTMTGIFYYKDERYLATNDHGSTKGWWLWKIETDVKTKAYTYKWRKLPRAGYLETFNFEWDKIPQTVAYQPLLHDIL